MLIFILFLFFYFLLFRIFLFVVILFFILFSFFILFLFFLCNQYKMKTYLSKCTVGKQQFQNVCVAHKDPRTLKDLKGEFKAVFKSRLCLVSCVSPDRDIRLELKKYILFVHCW